MTRYVPLSELRVYYHRTPDERALVGRLAYRENRAAFEYDADFRALGLELSPFRLALTEGLVLARPDFFEGLFGLFDDSLPDGWGRLLLDRHVASLGVNHRELTPLDRLAWVGSRAIGALSYQPERELESPDTIDLHALGEAAQTVLEDGTSNALETLLSVGGSPQGARPKALVLIDRSGNQIVAGAESREGFAPYLVKFSVSRDPKDSVGATEFAYSNMARAAGVAMPNTRLLAASGKHRGFFAIERFDRRGAQRIHTHTVSGLLDAPPLHTSITYEDLIKVTQRLTRDARQVKQMFRRATFNVYAHNRDDHSRNFAFLMEPDGTWKLAPAYDLTFSDGPGGEHTMLVGGEGRNPTENNLLGLAGVAGIKPAEAEQIIEEVRTACVEWATFAEQAKVPEKDNDRIETALARIRAL